MKLSHKKIMITGGASGIGLGLTERFVQDHNTVIICGRRKEKLDEVAARFPSKIIPKVCDVSNERDVAELYHWIRQEHNDVNVLVNNAGIQNWMDLSQKDFYQRAKKEVDTNVMAPIHLTTKFMGLESLETIMMVTSGLAFVPAAQMPIYCATKAFMRSFTLSLRYLMEPKGVHVIEIIPPALNTDLGGKGKHDRYPQVSEFIEAIFTQMHNGKKELTFGFSKDRTEQNNATILEYFKLLNP